VCRVLELTNPTMAAERLDDDESSTLSSTEGGPDRLIVSKPGLYALIQREPEACGMARAGHTTPEELRFTIEARRATAAKLVNGGMSQRQAAKVIGVCGRSDHPP
jgi:hypothetical protein